MQRYPHLLLTGVYSQQMTEDEAKTAFTSLVFTIGMTPIGPPVVNICPDHPWGNSYVQGLSESHISWHYMEKDVFAFDCFTCQDLLNPLQWLRTIKQHLMKYCYVVRFCQEQIIWRGI